MGKTGKVETVLSNDGKTRLKGNVGSHSTLVTQAKAPTTDINNVKIEKEIVAPVEMKVINKGDLYNAKDLADLVVGHRIVKAEETTVSEGELLRLTLDNGHIVELESYSDYGAHAHIEEFISHPELFDHVITSVTQEYEKETSEYDGEYIDKWFILAEMNQLLGFKVEGDCGNGYYSAGITLKVKAPKE